MFWGEPTSSVDWCEANYYVSPYVAEWWNTLSSLAMVLVGCVGALRARALVGRVRGFGIAAFVLLAVVGLGSIAFHGTLRFELQMLDELPMVYLVLLIVWWLVGARWTWGFVAYGVVLTALVTVARGQVQFYVFQVGFGTLELYAIGRTWWRQRSAEREVRRLFARGIALYAIAVLAWFVDTSMCYQLLRWATLHGAPTPHLHAVWHILVSLGFYALLQVIIRTDFKRAGTPGYDLTSRLR